MRKFIKFFRGLNLIILNSLHFKTKLLGLKLIILLIINSISVFLYFKIKNKKLTKDFSNYIKKFKLSKNYFKSNPAIWFEIFKRNSLIDKKISVLEIGSFEGMSILFFQKYLNLKEIYSIDLYDNYNFKSNRKKFNNIKFYKMSSDNFFKNKFYFKFDIIYIDGSHDAPEVFKDLINANKYLKKNGILIIDDFLIDINFRKGIFDKNGKYVRDGKCYDEVMGGVFMFLKKIKSYQMLYTGHQLIMKKIK